MVLHKLCINNDDDTEADTTLNIASVHAFASNVLKESLLCATCDDEFRVGPSTVSE